MPSRRNEPRDLGDLRTAPAGTLRRERVRDRHRRCSVPPSAIRYERPLVSDSFRLMPVAGRPNVWVEVRVPPRSENIRWVPPIQFTGRLVKFDTAGPRHRGLAAAVERRHRAEGAEGRVAARRRRSAERRARRDPARPHVPRLRAVERHRRREGCSARFADDDTARQRFASRCSIALASRAGSGARPTSFMVCAPMISASAMLATVSGSTSLRTAPSS